MEFDSRGTHFDCRQRDSRDADEMAERAVVMAHDRFFQIVNYYSANFAHARSLRVNRLRVVVERVDDEDRPTFVLTLHMQTALILVVAPLNMSFRLVKLLSHGCPSVKKPWFCLQQKLNLSVLASVHRIAAQFV